MAKEIHEQPQAIRDTFAGRVDFETGEIAFDTLVLEPAYLASVARIQLLACGTSWHAALVGKFLIEEIARIPVEVDYASEYRYRNPIVDPSCWWSGSRSRARRSTPCGRWRPPRRRARPDRDRQRARLAGHAHQLGRALHPRRPGDRGRLDQGLHHPSSSPSTCSPSTCASSSAARSSASCSSRSPTAQRSPRRSSSSPRSRSSRAGSTRRPTSSTSGAASSTRSRSRARSSSRRSPTSTPRAIPPAR